MTAVARSQETKKHAPRGSPPVLTSPPSTAKWSHVDGDYTRRFGVSFLESRVRDVYVTGVAVRLIWL
ncbi:hypothetical protein GW17_00006520 [Ensete ventricosum]|nr:hypothetical protein GW17_00006520 [Ensete ventricosum]